MPKICKEKALIWWTKERLTDIIPITKIPKARRQVNAILELPWKNFETGKVTKQQVKIIGIDADVSKLEAISMDTEGNVCDKNTKIFPQPVLDAKKEMVRNANIEKNLGSTRVKNRDQNILNAVPLFAATQNSAEDLSSKMKQTTKKRAVLDLATSENHSIALDDSLQIPKAREPRQPRHAVSSEATPAFPPATITGHQVSHDEFPRKKLGYAEVPPATPSTAFIAASPRTITPQHAHPGHTSSYRGQSKSGFGSLQSTKENILPQYTEENLYTQRSANILPRSIQHTYQAQHNYPVWTANNGPSLFNASDVPARNTDFFLPPQTHSEQTFSSIPSAQTTYSTYMPLVNSCGPFNLPSTSPISISQPLQSQSPSVSKVQSANNPEDQDQDLGGKGSGVVSSDEDIGDFITLIPGEVTDRDIRFQEKLLAAMRKSVEKARKQNPNYIDPAQIPEQYITHKEDTVEICPGFGIYFPLHVKTYIEKRTEVLPGKSDWNDLVREALVEIYGKSIMNFSAKGATTGQRPGINRQVFEAVYGWACTRALAPIEKKDYVDFINRLAANKRKNYARSKRISENSTSTSGHKPTKISRQILKPTTVKCVDVSALETEETPPTQSLQVDNAGLSRKSTVVVASSTSPTYAPSQELQFHELSPMSVEKRDQYYGWSQQY